MRILTENLVSAEATEITASSEDANFPASNLSHAFRSKRWRATDCTSENVVFDLQTTREVDSVVILWPKEDGIRLTNDAEIRIQASATDVWSSPVVDEVLSVNNTYMIASHYFSTVQSYRYWRVVVTDPGNPWDVIEIGKVWLGTSVDCGSCQNGFKIMRQDLSKQSRTDYGHVYTDEYPQQVSVQFQFDNLEYEAVVSIDTAFINNGSIVPVLIVLDELATVFDSDHFTVYGLFDSKLGLSHKHYNLINVDSITVTELA